MEALLGQSPVCGGPLGIAEGEHGAGRLADDPLGNRAEQDVRESRPAMGGDDDQIDLVFLRIVHDRLDRASPPHGCDHAMSAGPRRA